MKKILLPGLLLLWGYVSLQAQMPVYYTNSVPVIDGLSDDWDLSKANYFNSKAKQVLSANRIKYILTYDEQNLYGLFQISDQHLTDLALDKSGSPRLAYNDAIELYIDARNNSGHIMDASDYQLLIDLNGNITVFRGGDRFLMQIEEAEVPKDTITNSFVIEARCIKKGTVNNGSDVDNGYTIEFRLPWASLGVVPVENEKFRMDVCFNDADKFLDIKPLTEDMPIPHYCFESITGNSDFGFPDKWIQAKLTGHASAWKKFNEKLGYYRWFFPLIILLFLLPLTLYLFVSNKKLKQKQPGAGKTDINSADVYTEDENRHQDVIPENTISVKARHFVAERIDTDITPAQLASELGVSLRQLQRIFREELNLTPNAFITSMKMEEAAALLKHHDLNISEVAYAVGFSDPAYFAKVFKKYFGKSPKEYLKTSPDS